MGDVVHALPVVYDILDAHPGAQIDWLVEEQYADIVRAHPGVRTVIALSLRRWRKSWWSRDTRQAWRAWREALRAHTYDAVIDLQGLVKSAWLARRARGVHFGPSFGSARESLAALFYDRPLNTGLGRTEAAVPRYRGLVASALGYTPKGAPRYGLQVEAAMPAWLPEGTRAYAMLLSATAKDRKLWAESHWEALGARLAAQGVLCVFAWGNVQERDRAERLADAVRKHAAGGAIAAPEAFGMTGWMDVLRAAALVVGVDTGLLYMAAAVGTPAVAIYTGSSPRSVAFESAGPWRSLGDTGQPPTVEAVLDACDAVLPGAAVAA